MKKWFEKILSWSPLLALFLFGFTIWSFLQGPDKDPAFFKPVCQQEKLQTVTKEPFLLVYRTDGCGSVPIITEERIEGALLWWKREAAPLKLPPLRPGTVIDVRPGQEQLRSRFGKPGSIQLPPLDEVDLRYALARNINSLIIAEARPGLSPSTRELLSEALALSLLGRDSYRVVASSRARDLSETISGSWPEIITRCPDPCQSLPSQS